MIDDYILTVNVSTMFAAILGGILQGAFYNLKSPKYMNYGSMGFTIGHEFAHGFDDTGKQLNTKPHKVNSS